MARINRQLQRELSLLLESRIKKDAVKDVIITDVECSRDLERAKVFFTAMNPRRRPALLKELKNIRGALRTLLGQAVRLRHIPALEFIVDESADYGERIDGILDRLGLVSQGVPGAASDADVIDGEMFDPEDEGEEEDGDEDEDRDEEQNGEREPER